MQIGPQIRKLREKRGWTARELDRQAGLAEGHTALIESGKRSAPSIETVRAFAIAFGITVDAILSE